MYYIYMYTLWLFNVAMENPPFSTANSHHSNFFGWPMAPMASIVKKLEGNYMYYV
jgi:hypothetical protein